MTTVIVGSGLSGLYAAWQLHMRGEDVVVIEGRARIGGRVLSEQVTPDGPAFDLGPTWFWPDHQHRFADLIGVLGLSSFPQFDDGMMLFEPQSRTPQQVHPQPMGPKSHRVDGGMGAVIQALAAQLPTDTVKLSQTVNRIEEDGDRIRVASISEAWTADRVLLAIPPRIAANRIKFEPALPDEVKMTLNAVPTWMAGQAKIVAVYSQPFWRSDGLSGHAFSYQGPLMEIHDASPAVGGPFALFGFVGVPALNRRGHGQALETAVVRQLGRLFGERAEHPLSVLCKDWADDKLTATDFDMAPLGGHPIYQPLTLPSVWQGRIDFIGTEVAPANGGYLEGCLEAVDAVLGLESGTA